MFRLARRCPARGWTPRSQRFFPGALVVLSGMCAGPAAPPSRSPSRRPRGGPGRVSMETERTRSAASFPASRRPRRHRHHDAAGPRAGRQVDRLEAKVVEPLKSYGTIVKLKRAENELQRATLDATRTTRHLEETIDNFEKQKIRDIKNIFSEFITIEMLFHGKALEIYTAAYQNIQNIDENEDLEVFRSSLYPPDYQSRLDIVRANSKSPLQRTGSLKSPLKTAQISRRMLKKDEEEEEEEDEDSEEEDEEDEFDANKEVR
ncbi:CBY1-interacting BAR domain-containing protein 1 isoform X4 [Taeniopygia guttata]|uniref:CBY1-interacting BAR domain-containing protein 1 isoform X4 n=1 Tax=Taeniopygia guttata TaxID=59729 RepID=UPI003BB914C9